MPNQPPMPGAVIRAAPVRCMGRRGVPKLKDRKGGYTVHAAASAYLEHSGAKIPTSRRRSHPINVRTAHSVTRCPVQSIDSAIKARELARNRSESRHTRRRVQAVHQAVRVP